MRRVRIYLIGLFLGLAGFASATGLSLFQGAMDPAGFQNDINSMILAMNAQINSYLAFNASTAENGELYLPGAGSWKANNAVNTGLTAVGPNGAHTTVQEWLVFVDPQGFARYVPAF